MPGTSQFNSIQLDSVGLDSIRFDIDPIASIAVDSIIHADDKNT